MIFKKFLIKNIIYEKYLSSKILIEIKKNIFLKKILKK
jgi:hypothetical protein